MADYILTRILAMQAHIDHKYYSYYLPTCTKKKKNCNSSNQWRNEGKLYNVEKKKIINMKITEVLELLCDKDSM